MLRPVRMSDLPDHGTKADKKLGGAALLDHAKLMAKSTARALAMFSVHALVGPLFHWIAFLFALHAIWSPRADSSRAGWTPWLVSLVYLVVLPLVCLLLGKKMALHAFVERVMREKAGALCELVVNVSMRATAALSVAPGMDTARSIAQSLNDAVEGLADSTTARFVLRALLRALRIPQLLAASDFLTQRQREPEAAREKLRLSIEPRIAELGSPPSFGPLLSLLAFTALATALQTWWTPL